MRPYRGRLAPTPTGYLHLGHAATFYRAWARCCQHAGTLLYRDEDLDPQRCRSDYAAAAMEDLQWLGLDWQEGPDKGGPNAPYRQSQRLAMYLKTWQKLHAEGWLYPCNVSRKQLRELPQPNDADAQDAEPCFPVAWRTPYKPEGTLTMPTSGVNWRFRVPDDQRVSFLDGNLGHQNYQSLTDFGDFIVWRREGVPSYELAVVADDLAMGITEVVRGADLLRSTARQLLLYQALGAAAPDYYHCELVRDRTGRRLAKRQDDLSLRQLRAGGMTPEDVLRMAGVKP